MLKETNRRILGKIRLDLADLFLNMCARSLVTGHRLKDKRIKRDDPRYKLCSFIFYGDSKRDWARSVSHA